MKKTATLIAAAALAVTTTAPSYAGSSCWNGRCNSWNHHGGGIGTGAAVALGLGAFALGAAVAPAYPWRAPISMPPFYTWLPGPYPYVTPHACWNFYASWYFPC